MALISLAHLLPWLHNNNMENRVNSESFVIAWEDSKTNSVSLQNAFLKFKEERQVREAHHTSNHISSTERN